MLGQLFNYIYLIFTSNRPSLYFLKLLIILALLLWLLAVYKESNVPLLSEGFSQSQPFVLKQDADVYDEFYVEVYDGLMETERHARAFLTKMVDMTESSVNNSVFLDIGSGTGCMVNELTEIGFNVYGVDKSQDMVDYSEKKYPGLRIKKGDVMDPMFFEKGTYSHILCNYFTIYEMEDKSMFFQNCYSWMKPNGYLILHLVDREKFDTMVPIGKSKLLHSPQGRVTDTLVEFDDFQYKSNYRFDTGNKMVFKETFTDKQNGNIRQNEKTLNMENIPEILEYASKAGFRLHGKSDMMEGLGDAYQYIYVFVRGNP